MIFLHSVNTKSNHMLGMSTQFLSKLNVKFITTQTSVCVYAYSALDCMYEWYLVYLKNIWRPGFIYCATKFNFFNLSSYICIKYIFKNFCDKNLVPSCLNKNFALVQFLHILGNLHCKNCLSLPVIHQSVSNISFGIVLQMGSNSLPHFGAQTLIFL